MEFVFDPAKDFPKLAWHAQLDLSQGICQVRSGSWVEIADDGFIEGVWDGHFGDFSFADSACVFGSGAIRRNDSIVFVSSAGTTDCLYYCEYPGRLEIANSLPLLLASIDDELDPQCTEYHVINESITHGIEQYQRHIPTRKGSITRLLHRNLVVDSRSVSEVEKPLDPSFGNFESYFAYLDGRYRKIAANAVDAERSMPMSIFSTQSRGYDSTAANAIAKKYGVDKVFTVTKGKAKGYYMGEGLRHEPDDDGSEICARFGLDCIALDRHGLGDDNAGEYLVYATMHESSDLNLLAVASFVERPTVLLTGCLGEIWYTEAYYHQLPWLLDSSLRRGDLGNHGMSETRLQAGYVQLPLPYIGARSRLDILAITMSDEMAPWRLCTAYDRPIPRRIAEEAGVPRQMFGQVKMASVVSLPAPALPLGKALRREFLTYLAQQGVLSRSKQLLLPVVRQWNAIVDMTTPTRHRWNYYLQRLISKITRRKFAFPPLWSKLNGRIFCFCVNRRAHEYRHMISLLAEKEPR